MGGGYVIESNINVPVQKFVSDSALFSLRWLNVYKCQYSCRTALSVLFTSHHSTSAQNDVVGWALSCCTRDVFNTDELPTQSQPKSSVIRRRTLHSTTGKDSPLCNTIVIVKATLGTISAYIAVEVGEYPYHIPLYWENCTRESTYHCTGKTVLSGEHLSYRCTGKTVLGRAPTTVLGNLYLGEHLPLYLGNCTQVSAYHCTGKSVLGREPAIVLGNMYLGKYLPLYWETVLGRAPTTVLGKLYLGEHLPLYWERRG